MSTNDDWLAAAFNEVFPAHVAAFTDLMIALRRDFEGDLDMMIVLAVIGDRQLARRDPRIASRDVVLDRALGEIEFGRDLAIALARRQKPQDFVLTRAEQ